MVDLHVYVVFPELHGTETSLPCTSIHTSSISSPLCDCTAPTRAPGGTSYGQRRSHKEVQAPVPIKEQSERASDSAGAVAPELLRKTCEVYYRKSDAFCKAWLSLETRQMRLPMSRAACVHRGTRYFRYCPAVTVN